MSRCQRSELVWKVCMETLSERSTKRRCNTCHQKHPHSAWWSVSARQVLLVELESKLTSRECHPKWKSRLVSYQKLGRKLKLLFDSLGSLTSAKLVMFGIPLGCESNMSAHKISPRYYDTLDGISNRIPYIPTGAGFLLSTVLAIFHFGTPQFFFMAPENTWISLGHQILCSGFEDPTGLTG